MKEPNIGSELALLRKRAKVSQADLAARMKMDQSSVSRLESGDAKPSDEDVQKYLAALNGHPAAKQFAEHLASEWELSERPAFSHPYRKELWAAECARVKLKKFIADPATPANLVQQAKLYDDGLKETASYLLDLRHNLAFIGNIMVGKTTALCFVTDLLIEGMKSMKQRVVLETGAGWVTLCEVQVSALDSTQEKGGKFGLVVYPHTRDEVFRLVSDICASLIAMRDGKESESRVPEEIENVLRSMAELSRKPCKDPAAEGKIEDPLLELAKNHDGPNQLTAEFISRIKLDERIATDLWHDAPNLQEGLGWLQSEFRKVNNGRNVKVSLPKRIDVFVPMQLLKDSPYEIKFIDTKGVDETAIRPDLQAYLDDPRTVTVLCSHFAPDATMLDVLAHLTATGKAGAISDRTVFLVLPHRDEALEIKSEDGEPIEEVSAAYALREAQIRSKLGRFPGSKRMPIVFFNASQDNPLEIAEALQQKIKELRNGQATRLEELTAAVDDLVSRHQEQQVQTALAKLRAKLQEFTDAYEQLPARTAAVESQMLGALRGRHARTVWASARRNGDFYNLDSYQYIGIATNVDAKTRSDPAGVVLDRVLDDLLQDPDCAAIQSHLLVLKKDFAAWRLKFLEEVTRRSQEIFRAVLYPDNPLWNACEKFWGEGEGFRRKVADKVEEWCKTQEHEWMRDAIEAIVRKDWQDLFIGPIQAMSKEPVAQTATPL